MSALYFVRASSSKYRAARNRVSKSAQLIVQLSPVASSGSTKPALKPIATTLPTQDSRSVSRSNEMCLTGTSRIRSSPQ